VSVDDGTYCSPGPGRDSKQARGQASTSAGYPIRSTQVGGSLTNAYNLMHCRGCHSTGASESLMFFCGDRTRSFPRLLSLVLWTECVVASPRSVLSFLLYSTLCIWLLLVMNGRWISSQGEPVYGEAGKGWAGVDGKGVGAGAPGSTGAVLLVVELLTAS
jgi:hypothetical protein